MEKSMTLTAARYHTHNSAQYAGGAVGPMVIYGPSNEGADIDIGPVMLNDWYRDDYMTSIRGLMNPLSLGGPKLPLANSNLINGKMRYPCSKANVPCVTTDYARFNFNVGKDHRLRLINTGSNTVQKFSIDGHVMRVIANDFMPVKPYNTSMIALGVGQRADVIVYGSGKRGDVLWMRSNMVACSFNDGLFTEALGIIYYPGADPNTLPTAPPNTGPAASTDPRSCSNDALTQTEPTFPLKASTPDAVKEFDISMKSNGTHMLMYMGSQSFRANFNNPVLSHALSSRLLNIGSAAQRMERRCRKNHEGHHIQLRRRAAPDTSARPQHANIEPRHGQMGQLHRPPDEPAETGCAGYAAGECDDA